MKLTFDIRILSHKTYTGVENYTKYILEFLEKRINVNKVFPKNKNKYISHLWCHFILAFKKGNILFCPANTAPYFVPKNKKLVLTVHDIAFLRYPKSFSLFFRSYYKFIMPKIINRSNKIITVSQSSKEEILKYYNIEESKIKVIHLGIDKKYKVIQNIKKENIILYVGSLNERKNFCSLIEAFELLNNISYKLYIIGNFSSNFIINERTKKILLRAKKNLNIKFKININDEELIKLYNRSKCFIFPSFYEGFGLPPLEAMSCGTPVITSNLTSMPEICADAALYIDPYDIEDIKNKIELLLNDDDLQNELIKKGLKRAKGFTWEKAASEHLKVFEEALKD